MDPIALQRYISHYHTTTSTKSSTTTTIIDNKSKRNDNNESIPYILLPTKQKIIANQNINFNNCCSYFEAINNHNNNNLTKQVSSSDNISKGMFSSSEYNNCTYYTVAAVDCGNFVVNGSVATVVQPLSQVI